MISPIINQLLIPYVIAVILAMTMRKKGLAMVRAQNENLKPIWNGQLFFMSLYVAFATGANKVANPADAFRFHIWTL